MNKYRLSKHGNPTVKIGAAQIELGISVHTLGVDWGAPIIVKAIATSDVVPMMFAGYVRGHMGWKSTIETCYYPGYLLVFEWVSDNTFLLVRELSVTKENNLKKVMAEVIDEYFEYDWNINIVRRKRIVA